MIRRGGGTNQNQSNLENTSGSSFSSQEFRQENQSSNSSQDPQEPVTVQKLKETKNCYSVISGDANDYLLACKDTNNKQNLAFYYYSDIDGPSLSAQVTSLSAQREWGWNLIITLKMADGEKITFRTLKESHTSPWFWSWWFRKEMKLDNLCKETNVHTTHNNNRKPLSCQWEWDNQKGTEVWYSFSL